MIDYKNTIHNWMNNHRNEGVSFLKKLVQEQSLQGYESRAQAIVIEKCVELGLDVDSWVPGGPELLNHIAFVSPRETFNGSQNVVATLKGSGGGKSLILNGHIDVVPSGEEDQWDVDSFSGLVKDGKLYGRGSTDMKGGTVSLLLAVEAIIKSGIVLKGDVIFQSVIEEESGGAGTLAAILRGYKADGAIIPEPTNMKIFPKQQGSLWFRLTVTGKSAHGGTRYEGVSAIEKSILVLQSIEKLETNRNEQINDPLYDNIQIPVPINVGTIKGGSWPSSVPDSVIIEGRMGVIPEETMEEAKESLEKWVANLKYIDPWFITNSVKVEWWGARWIPGTIDADHELLSTLKINYKEIINKEPIIEASPWGTDGGLLTNVGDIPTVVFGPGTTEVAHFPNEYIEIDRVFEVAEIIALTMIQWCQTKTDT
ncbi:peptidase [Bacillus sp. PS06]|uniref:peptidase n=1 Tax=Bacillus sp. PS06 TaxID=2764176 RepID=UPI001785CEC0|nr:peptidase [Bacillus sp. PS06]MBD8068047.1 peptidase [Bacillus sp. PS06]